MRAGRPAPFTAAAAASRVVALSPGAELLAWWCADLVLAQKLRWPRPVPLLMAQAFALAFRTGDGRAKRIRPGEQKEFERAACLALAQGADDALRLAAELSQRAEPLAAVMPKLRAKGAGEVVKRLLDDDAMSGSLTTKTLSRFGSRRLFERLQTLSRRNGSFRFLEPNRQPKGPRPFRRENGSSTRCAGTSFTAAKLPPRSALPAKPYTTRSRSTASVPARSESLRHQPPHSSSCSPDLVARHVNDNS